MKRRAVVNGDANLTRIHLGHDPSAPSANETLSTFVTFTLSGRSLRYESGSYGAHLLYFPFVVVS